MMLYHATTIDGLDLLRAESHDRYGNKVLFLTDNFLYSLFYIRDREINFVTCGVRESGIVHYDEKFPDQLKTLYSGMSGWVYVVETDAEHTNIPGIYVLRNAVPIVEKIYIPDVYHAIQLEIRKGNVHLHNYEKATEIDRHYYHQGILRELVSDNILHPKKAEFYRVHFPDAWEEAKRILDKSQLQCYDNEK